MEINEIKKALYKQKPKATFFNANKDGLHYLAYLDEQKSPHVIRVSPVRFLIPFGDIGDANFAREIDAQLLIRYII